MKYVVVEALLAIKIKRKEYIHYYNRKEKGIAHEVNGLVWKV